MKAEIEDWNNGWYGVSLGLKKNEIEHLITLLQKIKNDPDQHFHTNSAYIGNRGIGDIEVYVLPDEEAGNMSLSGLALAPDTELKA